MATPHTSTAVNQNNPSTGLNVVTSQFSLACVSMAPPMPAMAEETPNTKSLARRSWMPTDWAPVSESRMAAEHAAQPAAAQVAGQQEDEADPRQLVEVERLVPAQVEAEQGRAPHAEGPGRADEQPGVEHEAVDDQGEPQGGQAQEQSLATKRG